METIATKSARLEFSAVRDEAGTAHVNAPGWREALYAMGYLHAADRPTQLFFSRAVASGQAAERIANQPELLETDRFFRRAGLHRNLDREVANLPPAIRDQLQWYCDGVNDGLQDHGRSLPMWVTRFQPRPWHPTAVLLIGNLLSFAGLAVGIQESERLLLELVQAGIDPELLRELMSPYLDDVDFEHLYDIRMERRLSDEALEMLADLPRLVGSNAWAVAPRRSATGHALLASDPHLEVNRLPAIWYEVVLRWGDGQYAMGATLPGCPLMAVGRSSQLAWGVTYLHADTSDYFIEDCRPGGASGWQYRRGQHDWLDFRVREEQIERKGAPPSTLRIYENDLGTLAVDLSCGPDTASTEHSTNHPSESSAANLEVTPKEEIETAEEEHPPKAESDRPTPHTEAGKYLSVKWIGADEEAGRSIGCWLSIMQATSVRQAMDLVQHNPHPSLVWVFADREGHIGRQASGWLPKRAPGHTGLLPVPAWNRQNHWQGRQDDSLLPSLYDPPEGYLACANEDLNRAGHWLLNTLALPEYRKRRIVQRLHAMHDATVVDMQQLQYDVTSLQASDLLAIWLPFLPDGPLKEALADWDCRYHPDSTSAVLFQQLYRHVLLEAFGHDQGIGWRRMFYLCTRMGYSSMVLTAIDRLFHRPNSPWWQDLDMGQLIRRAAGRVSESMSQKKPQTWGEVNSFHFANRFFQQGRVGRLLGFHSSLKAMPGCQATPFQGHLLATATRESSFAPSYHFVTDLGTDLAWTNLPGGASESRFSKWYHTDIERWLTGEYRALESTYPKPGL
ncbi:MAG: penicillin acylase family protein [Pirellulales bacterium]